jgi:hypothetical protein
MASRPPGDSAGPADPAGPSSASSGSSPPSCRSYSILYPFHKICSIFPRDPEFSLCPFGFTLGIGRKLYFVKKEIQNNFTVGFLRSDFYDCLGDGGVRLVEAVDEGKEGGIKV